MQIVVISVPPEGLVHNKEKYQTICQYQAEVRCYNWGPANLCGRCFQVEGQKVFAYVRKDKCEIPDCDQLAEYVVEYHTIKGYKGLGNNHLCPKHTAKEQDNDYKVGRGTILKDITEIQHEDVEVV